MKCMVQDVSVDISFNQTGGLSTLCFLEQVWPILTTMSKGFRLHTFLIGYIIEFSMSLDTCLCGINITPNSSLRLLTLSSKYFKLITSVCCIQMILKSTKKSRIRDTFFTWYILSFDLINAVLLEGNQNKIIFKSAQTIADCAASLWFCRVHITFFFLNCEPKTTSIKHSFS